MTRILITGISGVVGSIISRDLKKDYDVIGLDKEDVDISDRENLIKFFDRLPKIDTVIHLAADPYPFAAWDLVLKNNVIGTRNVYEAAKNAGIKRIVFASSTHVVGKYPGFPITLSDRKILHPIDPVRPDEWYGASKAMGEIIARIYYDLYGLESIILRIGHVTANDDNSEEDLKKLFLTKADLVQLVRVSLGTNVGFGIYFAVSDVPGRFLDISSAVTDLNYKPSKQPV